MRSTAHEAPCSSDGDVPARRESVPVRTILTAIDLVLATLLLWLIGQPARVLVSVVAFSAVALFPVVNMVQRRLPWFMVWTPVLGGRSVESGRAPIGDRNFPSGRLAMFVQVIQGQVSDAGQVRAALDRWVRELAPGAVGWLGSTEGVTEDGRFIALARFESEEAARRNSARPEQDQWWAETSRLFTGEVTFRESTEVLVDVVGDPDTAGFVQVIQGRSSDPARAREIMGQDSSDWAAFRPDVIGSVMVEHDEGAYTMALYFTSEEEAREGERKEPPPDIKAQMEEMDALGVGEPEFFDLKRPWLYSSR